MRLFGMEMDMASLNEKYRGRAFRYLWKEILAFMLIGGCDTTRARCLSQTAADTTGSS